MTRFLLAICIVIGCAMGGRAVSAASRRRVRQLDDTLSGVRLLRIYMTRMLEPVPGALAQTEKPVLAAVGRAMAPGVDAGEAWREVRPALRRRGGAADAMTTSDVQTLDALFAHLGVTGREAQGVLLTACDESLSANLESARVRAAEADRLYLSLGLLFGLMLALMLM